MNFDLVFEGGGAKGMVFVGAMQEFEARGHKHGRLLGTSAGAITATFLTAEYTASEMLAALNEKLPTGKSIFSNFMAEPAPFDQAAVRNSAIRSFLQSTNNPFIPDFLESKLDDFVAATLANDLRARHLFSFVERGGWFSADNFLTWIHEKLSTGACNGKPRNFGDMTLKQFFEATGNELSLIAADTTGGQMLVLNHMTAPNCPVIWAARMSMSVPLLWQEVIWQAGWGPYLGQDLQGHSIVDGGLLSNFPIELFLSNLKDVIAVMGDKISENVLGMFIDDKMALPNLQQLPPPPTGFDFSQLQTAKRLSSLVDTAISARDKMIIDSYSNLVVRLPAKTYGTTEFDMTDLRRDALVSAGRQAMCDYFDRFTHPTAIAGESIFDPDVNISPEVQNTIDRVAMDILN